MTSAILIAGWCNLIAGIVIILVSLPLLLGKITPNPLYGVRTAASFKSTDNWYRINRYGAKALIAASTLIILCGLAGVLWVGPPALWMVMAVTLIPPLALLAACLQIWRYGRSL